MPKTRNSFRCPWCESASQLHVILAIASSTFVIKDPLLESEPLRFLPSHFDPDGWPLDPEGGYCTALACPKCRWAIPGEGLGLETIDAHMSEADFRLLADASMDPSTSRWLAFPGQGKDVKPRAIFVTGEKLVRIMAPKTPANGTVSYTPPNRPVLLKN